MKREYAQKPNTVFLARLNAAECEVLLRENITSEERTDYNGEKPVQITVYHADEYSLILPWREGLEEAINAAPEEWLVTARAKEMEEQLGKKLPELSSACYATITAGCDVQLADGSTEHFSLEETDQINLNAAHSAVEAGAEQYPYHADGKLCRLYSAEDINAIAKAATKHKLYHTTYCNHLMAWARRSTGADELEAIYYGAQLPEDLAENMAKVIANADSE